MTHPTTWAVLLLAVALLVLSLRYSVQLAKRLDRLHLRILSTRDALDALAVRRAAEARMLADSGLLEPERARELGERAAQCLRGDEALFVDDSLGRGRPHPDGGAVDARAVAVCNERESALTRTIRATLTPGVRDRLHEDGKGGPLVDSLDMACYRLQVARSMHNLDVSQVRRLRDQAWVRVFRLYGRAPAPDTIDFDDATTPASGA